MTEQELMLTSILHCGRTDLYGDPAELSLEEAQKLRDMQERRRQNEPLQYILGECEFMGLKLKVDRRALIPRPETELLVENILQLAQFHHGAQVNILDAGSGSGNISIALAKFIDGAKVCAMDISADALQLSRENARLNEVSHKIDFVRMDLLDFCNNYSEGGKRFDIIVSNPPYIKTSALLSLPLDVQQEPRLALDGGEDGLDFYRLIIGEAKRFLKHKGTLICEIGDGQKETVSALLHRNGFELFYFVNDYVGTPRLFIAQV